MSEQHHSPGRTGFTRQEGGTRPWTGLPNRNGATDESP